jgi:hypothetical protein
VAEATTFSPAKGVDATVVLEGSTLVREGTDLFVAPKLFDFEAERNVSVSMVGKFL